MCGRLTCTLPFHEALPNAQHQGWPLKRYWANWPPLHPGPTNDVGSARQAQDEAYLSSSSSRYPLWSLSMNRKTSFTWLADILERPDVWKNFWGSKVSGSEEQRMRYSDAHWITFCIWAKVLRHRLLKILFIISLSYRDALFKNFFKRQRRMWLVWDLEAAKTGWLCDIISWPLLGLPSPLDCPSLLLFPPLLCASPCPSYRLCI